MSPAADAVFSVVTTIGELNGTEQAVWSDGPVVVAELADGTYSAYDPRGSVLASHVPLTGLDVSCGIIAAPDGESSALYAVTTTEAPAQGINPAQQTVRLTRLSPALVPQWSSDLVTRAIKTGGLEDNGHLCGTGARASRAVTVTADGKWAAVVVPGAGVNGYVDSAGSGFHATDGFTLALGDRIAVRHDPCTTVPCSEPTSFAVTDPATGATATYTEGHEVSPHSSVEATSVQAFLGCPCGSDGGGVIAFDAKGEGIYPGGDSLAPALYLLDPRSLHVTRIGYDAYGLNDHYAVDPQTDTVVIDSGITGPDALTGVAIPDGTRRWSVDARLCGAGNGTVTVAANGQFAQLDAATGRQLTSTTDVTACPTAVDLKVSGGAYGWLPGTTGTQVIRLAPQAAR
ncbi:hypothetical protein LO772_32555 [Yinghuangia sp. ASG 101]|uniref:hypothetical protein n=1 Tax=Yinghuangia sp. ASG 101 TaxID=2896848 RepID=UPI001E324952|nr:hypothetical protein [Yinghuangia sp. ASG 101]UGQ11467.1 hypothetical protein LO772_32555 [Yinghuangia sp. ASG 101]